MQSNIVNIDSIDAYNKLFGLPTTHPLVSVVDLKHAKSIVNHVRINYGVYALFLKTAFNAPSNTDADSMTTRKAPS